MTEKQTITYFYLEGRAERINKDSPNDFFYFYQFYDKNYYDTDFIEENFSNLKPSNIFLYGIDKVLRKLTKLSIHSYKFLNIKNIRVIINSDNLVFTNESVGFSLLIFLAIIKLFKNIDTNVFIMGSFDKVNKFGFFSKIYLKFMIKTYDKFIFLGLGELEYARKTYPKFDKKFYYLPFSVDQEFWSAKHCLVKDRKEKNVLFIGNDLNRDYKFLTDLCNETESIKFTIITNRINPKTITSSNTLILNGDWRENKISDTDLRKIYAESTITIIPLIETYQPSGQSVALQSMSMETPVVITKTNGFWDKDMFTHQENIIFMEENNVNTWKIALESLIHDQNKLSKIADNAKSIIVKELNQKHLFEKFLIILNS
tara:strand:- start:48 stop:1163 length:1116 start_codon:yes stop_codon:yes gene_type:complete